MNKFFSVLFFLVLMNFSFSIIKANHLRQTQEEIPNLDSLLAGLPISYDILRNELESKIAPIRNTLELSYFKSLEASSKVNYYLNKEPKDFKTIINDIIDSMSISNPNHAYLHNIFEYKIQEYEQYSKFNTWMNYNFITTVRTDKNSISYGSLFITKKDEKYNIIFCYGVGDFKVNYNGMNVVFLGKDDDYKYAQTYGSTSFSSKDLDEKDSNYIIMFMNLEGFKVLGRKYNIPLVDPNID